VNDLAICNGFILGKSHNPVLPVGESHFYARWLSEKSRNAPPGVANSISSIINRWLVAYCEVDNIGFPKRAQPDIVSVAGRMTSHVGVGCGPGK